MKNKRIKYLIIGLTILTCLLSNKTSFSQTSLDSNRNEIGFGTAYFPMLFNGLIFLPNISYKYEFNKNAIRTGFSYDLFVKDLKNNSAFMGNIGYERRFGRHRVQMIAGADICYAREVDYINDFNGNDNYKMIYSLFGAGPVIGCIYNINSSFSIQTELGCIYGYS
jgi:hypothetical protein